LDDLNKTPARFRPRGVKTPRQKSSPHPLGGSGRSITPTAQILGETPPAASPITTLVPDSGRIGGLFRLCPTMGGFTNTWTALIPGRGQYQTTPVNSSFGRDPSSATCRWFAQTLFGGADLWWGKARHDLPGFHQQGVGAPKCFSPGPAPKRLHGPRLN